MQWWHRAPRGRAQREPSQPGTRAEPAGDASQRSRCRLAPESPAARAGHGPLLKPQAAAVRAGERNKAPARGLRAAREPRWAGGPGGLGRTEDAWSLRR